MSRPSTQLPLTALLVLVAASTLAGCTADDSSAGHCHEAPAGMYEGQDGPQRPGFCQSLDSVTYKSTMTVRVNVTVETTPVGTEAHVQVLRASSNGTLWPVRVTRVVVYQSTNAGNAEPREEPSWDAVMQPEPAACADCWVATGGPSWMGPFDALVLVHIEGKGGWIMQYGIGGASA